MSHKRHEKLKLALQHPDLTICKRFGDEGPVDVGLLGWGSTFGEILEAMFIAREEGIRCAAMKVVMLSPLPLEDMEAFMSDCGSVLVPELNYEGQFANLVSGATGRPVHRLNQVTGTPMEVEAILRQIRTLAKVRSAA
jgi:2-oxoglutarate ferredoxin oxidoreductase subunit alpha